MATLRDIERDTLRQITQIGEFGRIPTLQNAARTALSSLHEKGDVNIHLGFVLDIMLRGDRRRGPVKRRIDIGGIVQASPDKKSVSNASYSLLICRYADPAKSPIVRKVHFDYESLEMRNQGEPKPSAHLQICGNLSPHHLSAGYSHMRLNALYPRWEKPRIPLPPTSIAILLNWLLLEFQTDTASQGILNSPNWRKLVARAERAVLTKYFSECSDFFTSAANTERRFLQNLAYGMSVD